MNRIVVVGVDGTPASLDALDVAADEAVKRSCALRIAHAEALPGHPPEAAQAVVRDAAARARGRSEELTIETCHGEEPAGPYLSRLSESADLLVVGSRGLSGLTGLLAGSVSAYVAAHARCPVLIVPVDRVLRQAPESPGTIVVGIDPQHPAAPSVEFALREAGLRQVGVRVVIATPALPDAEHVADLVGERRTAYPRVALYVDQVDLPPDEALIAASEEAGLLVIGTHVPGHLGRVAHAALKHAFCPVAVVPQLV